MKVSIALVASRQLFSKEQVSSADALCNFFQGIFSICIILVYPRCFLVFALNSWCLEKYCLLFMQSMEHGVPLCRADPQVL